MSDTGEQRCCYGRFTLAFCSHALLFLSFFVLCSSAPEAAFEMLSSLNNRTHQVVTGCTLLFHSDASFGSSHDNSSSGGAEAADASEDPLVFSFSVSTDVTFSPLPSSALRLYISSGEPFDKAGGYGYQSLAATFVSEIRGCYYNVVGFPLHALAKEMQPRLEEILKHREGQKEK